MTYLAGGSLALALLGGVFAGGYLDGTRHEAERVITNTVVQTKTQMVENVAVENKLKTQINSLNKQDLDLTNDLRTALNSYPPACDVTPGDQRLLDTLTVPATSVASNKSPGQGGAAASAATISERDLEADDGYARTEYEKVRLQLNTLIDQMLKK